MLRTLQAVISDFTEASETIRRGGSGTQSRAETVKCITTGII